MRELDNLFSELLTLQDDKKLPPVTSWKPTEVGQIDIKIDANGAWWHEGRKIVRQGLVNVFSTILVKHIDAYYLVTPQEKLRIEVADVPFIGVNFESVGEGQAQRVMVSTNVDDHVLIDRDHPLAMRNAIPYLRVRDKLDARINRATFYRLVERGVEEDGQWVIYSDGSRFTLGDTA